MRFRTLLLVSVAVVAALAAATPPVLPTADAQAPTPTPKPMPWPVTYGRTVSPLSLPVGRSVHVAVNVDGTTAATSQGIDVFFVVDRSPTMFDDSITRPDFMARTKDALKNFLNAMDFGKSKAGVITFAAAYQVNRNLSNQQDALIQTIDRIVMSEESDVRGLSGAFRKATELIDNDGSPANKKYIVVFIAGPDVGQQLINMPTVTQAARNAGVNVVFMMWASANTDSAYGHYVAASSDCTWTRCTNWDPLGRRYSWRISPNGERGGALLPDLMSALAGHLLFTTRLARIELEEAYDPRIVDFIAITPPESAPGPPFTNVLWRSDTIPPGGLLIEYDAQMLQEGTHRVALMTRLKFIDSDGVEYGPYDLENPEVTVLGRVTPTATPTVGPSDTPVPTTETPGETPTGSPTTPGTPGTPGSPGTPGTPDVTPTDQAPGHHAYIPIAIRIPWGRNL